MKSQDLSDELVRYLNNEMAFEQARGFLRGLHLKDLNGPDTAGFIEPEERIMIYKMLMNHEKGRSDKEI